ncbi:hypothetical protein CYY_009480 [Polysphondylium violaceum]|uniref:Uncharacterized protein n=1 Tax=Polysphondylium violaceum TaxID=133409 RepID=A0A8J4PLM4_9MYCE|nr:hypothetical protein CYY_009480 [Polysphondylium violaceum]
MVLYGQWNAPTCNKGWKGEENKKFTLKIKESDPPHQKGPNNRYVVLDKGFIPRTVTRIDIQESMCSYRHRVLYQGKWIPDSVTMLSVPSLPFTLYLIPGSVKYLKVQRQGVINTGIVPLTIQYLWIESLFSGHFSHNIPNTVKELVLGSCSLNEMCITPTFTPPIYINDLKVYNEGEIKRMWATESNDKEILQNMFIIIRSITTTTQISISPIILSTTYFSQTLIPTTLSHLELTVTVYKTTFTNDWLGKKGYLPLSITHLKVNLESGSKGEKYGPDGDDTLSRGIQIILPSSLQSVCLVPNNKEYRKYVSIIDKQDYYSTTPTLPKIREGLKEIPKLNKHLIKNLTYRSGTQSNFEKLLDMLPNLQYLCTDDDRHDIRFKVPSSVTELKSFMSSIWHQPILLNLKHVHFDLETYVSNTPRVVKNEIFDVKKGTLEHIDRFKHYNIIIKNKEQLVPALSKFDKADQIYITEKGKEDDLSKLISRSIKKLRCTFTKVFLNGLAISLLTISHYLLIIVKSLHR